MMERLGCWLLDCGEGIYLWFVFWILVVVCLIVLWMCGYVM